MYTPCCISDTVMVLNLTQRPSPDMDNGNMMIEAEGISRIMLALLIGIFLIRSLLVFN